MSKVYKREGHIDKETDVIVYESIHARFVKIPVEEAAAHHKRENIITHIRQLRYNEHMALDKDHNPHMWSKEEEHETGMKIDKRKEKLVCPPDISQVTDEEANMYVKFFSEILK